MNNVTLTQLEAICTRINRLTDSPLSPYSEGKSNIGNYHLDGAYGGYALHRMDNESGGVTDVLQCGHTTKRDLAERMWAWIRGYEACNAARQLAEAR